VGYPSLKRELPADTHCYSGRNSLRDAQLVYEGPDKCHSVTPYLADLREQPADVRPHLTTFPTPSVAAQNRRPYVSASTDVGFSIASVS
jgi:hypothetical protein